LHKLSEDQLNSPVVIFTNRTFGPLHHENLAATSFIIADSGDQYLNDASLLIDSEGNESPNMSPLQPNHPLIAVEYCINCGQRLTQADSWLNQRGHYASHFIGLCSDCIAE
jgi:hypothetical protein